MTISSWLRSPRSAACRPPAPRRRSPLRGLSLESLEDRTLLNAGALDLSFGSGGKVTTDFAGATDVGRDLAIQPDGKILVVGYADNVSSFGLARYNTDGTPDMTFG